MDADAVVYLDSSALVKLVVLEPESAALAGHLSGRPNRVSCALARVEVLRAVRMHSRSALDRAGRLLRAISLVQLDDSLLDDAASLDHDNLRSLDAIHLAGARALGPGLTEIVTYDHRMASAAQALGFAVIAPGRSLA